MLVALKGNKLSVMGEDAMWICCFRHPNVLCQFCNVKKKNRDRKQPWITQSTRNVRYIWIFIANKLPIMLHNKNFYYNTFVSVMNTYRIILQQMCMWIKFSLENNTVGVAKVWVNIIWHCLNNYSRKQMLLHLSGTRLFKTEAYRMWFLTVTEL